VDVHIRIADLREAIKALAYQYGVEDVRVFGSVARGDVTDSNDIDLLVRLQKGRSLLDLIGFKQDVEELLGVEVDVVTEGGLDEMIREEVMAEAIAI
jgi:hypothetical protein